MECIASHKPVYGSNIIESLTKLPRKITVIVAIGSLALILFLGYLYYIHGEKAFLMSVFIIASFTPIDVVLIYGLMNSAIRKRINLFCSLINNLRPDTYAILGRLGDIVVSYKKSGTYGIIQLLDQYLMIVKFREPIIKEQILGSTPSLLSLSLELGRIMSFREKSKLEYMLLKSKSPCILYTDNKFLSLKMPAPDSKTTLIIEGQAEIIIYKCKFRKINLEDIERITTFL